VQVAKVEMTVTRQSEELGLVIVLLRMDFEQHNNTVLCMHRSDDKEWHDGE